MHTTKIEDFNSKVTDNLSFGKYPTQKECDILVREGFDFFVDLTTPEEITWALSPGGKGYVLPKGVTYIRCPIEDRTPNARDKDQFLRTIKASVKAYQDGRKIEVYCRGGHGRSGMVTAILLCILESIGPAESLKRIQAAHSQRKVMKPQFRKMGAPQTQPQKRFVASFMKEWSAMPPKKSTPKYAVGADGYYVVTFVN